MNTSKELVPAKSTVTVVILLNEPNLEPYMVYIARLTRKSISHPKIDWLEGVRLFTMLHLDFDQDVV